MKPENSDLFSIISSIFVATLIISNTVGEKIIQIFNFSLNGGIIVFPISYIFGDILTEVYGYKASRKIIWTGLFCLVLMSTTYYLVQILPPASFWKEQSSYEAILGVVPRISLASAIAYFTGEFSNSYTLAKMKLLTKGKYLWTRTISSTLIGQGVDTLVFSLVAFWGVFSPSNLTGIVISNYIFKVVYEIMATPITYLIVNYLKRNDGVDMYDYQTDFNPFTLK